MSERHAINISLSEIPQGPIRPHPGDVTNGLDRTARQRPRDMGQGVQGGRGQLRHRLRRGQSQEPQETQGSTGGGD